MKFFLKLSHYEQTVVQSYRLACCSLLLFILCSCSNSGPQSTAAPSVAGHVASGESHLALDEDGLMLADFEDGKIPDFIHFTHAKGSLVAAPKGSGSGKKSLRVEFSSFDNKYASISLEPDQPWDWSQYRDFSIAFDIANEGQHPVHFHYNISDANGWGHTRNVAVSVGPSKTYYAKLEGHDLHNPEGRENEPNELNHASGLRGNPPSWRGYGDQQMIWMWGKKHLDLQSIRKIDISIQYVLHDKELTIDNIRLIPNPPMNEVFLTGLVDEYGQNAHVDFDGKIHTLEQLKKEAEAEVASLAGGELLADRSTYSGWKNGPKLKASGYFRAEKVNGKWSLVDPEGYLFFATGIDVIRLSNSTTMTGYDFDRSLIPARTVNDVTPEDSQPINRAPKAAWPTRYLASELRKNMFEWLPAYDDELGNHFGYRREAHSGALPHGETFSFYSANLERRYGETYPESYLDDWRKITVDRMRNWGFTSLGNWADPSFYPNNRIPFFANGWIIGDFKTVSSGSDFWSPLPDVFDPAFEQRAMRTLEVVAEEVKNSPWCVGVFIDNEKSFGRSDTPTSRLGIVVHTLRRDGVDVPTKAKFTQLMKEKYTDIAVLNTAWGKNISSWQEFNKGIDSTLSTEQQEQDYSLLLSAYADQYFGVVKKALKHYLPNHMYLGSRFPDWGMPKEVFDSSTKYVDVLSFNSYKEGLPHYKWKFLEEVDMPAIIGEFHVGATDAGLVHPGLIQAENQTDRALLYKEFMYSVIDNPNFIGAHWFQYLDSPVTGRAYDGENYNVGFVSVTDVPYAKMVEAAKELHGTMYERRFGAAGEK